MKLTMLTLALVSLMSCKGEMVTDEAAVKYADDIKMICNSRALSGAEQDPSRAAATMADYIDSNIKSAKGREFIENMATMAPASRSGTLRDEAKKAGLEKCAFLDDN